MIGGQDPDCTSHDEEHQQRGVAERIELEGTELHDALGTLCMANYQSRGNQGLRFC
jgi:hypothetical protein